MQSELFEKRLSRGSFSTLSIRLFVVLCRARSNRSVFRDDGQWELELRRRHGALCGGGDRSEFGVRLDDACARWPLPPLPRVVYKLRAACEGCREDVCGSSRQERLI